MDPLQWMGAINTRVQTADKNITIIYKGLLVDYCEVFNQLFDSIQPISSFEAKSWNVCKKQTHY